MHTKNKIKSGAIDDCDIYIAGSGIVSVDQITNEVDRAIRRSNEVIYVDNGIGIYEFLSERCEKVTDLIEPSYVINENRINAYHNMAARVLEAALSHAPVTFLLYGHPTVFSYPPFIISRAAKLLNLKIKVLPGISAMGCIFAELGLDPGSVGLQIHEATNLILKHIPLVPEIPALIWQIGSLETCLYSSKMSNRNRYARFREYLLKYYSEDHVVTAIFCSSYPLMPTEVINFPLGKIADYAVDMHSGYTLYIPPAVEDIIKDEQLAKDIVSVEHLETITI